VNTTPFTSLQKVPASLILKNEDPVLSSVQCLLQSNKGVGYFLAV